MSAAVHTPGLWQMKVANDGCGYIGIVGDGGVLAECFHEIRASDEKAYKEMLANARLIVAAPELLTALQAMVLAYDNLEHVEGGMSGLPQLERAAKAADTAVLKATGGPA